MVFDISYMGDEMEQLSVLVVDDEQQIRSILAKLLKECGYEVALAKDSAEALKALESQNFDIVLCDVIMPNVSGLAILGKARELHKAALIIMMSGYADLPMAREALNLGANDFLIKPFSLLTVPIAIERNLRYRQAEINRITEQRNKVLLESIKALSAAMDAKEHNTVEHSERIASTALMIAEAMGLPQAAKSTLELAAYMHDIGKIGVRESVLLKPGKLSKADWREIKAHPDTGSHILSKLEGLSDLVEIIRHHHERVDGQGYPDGLAGEQIPLLSRILSVADAFDAMTSDRPYRPQMTEAEALNRLKADAGTHFDSEIVDIFLKYMGEEIQKAA